MKSLPESHKEIWIGMVEVRPSIDSSVIADADGAFVNVLTWASNSNEFRQKVGELMNDLRLHVTGIESAEPLTQRGPEESLDQEIRRVAGEVRRNPDAIMYSTFHTWSGPVQ
jgi:hypothetical protein